MKQNVTSPSPEQILKPLARRVEGHLRKWLVEPGTPAALAAAIRYCVLGGGKRLRPALVHLAAEAAGGPRDEESAARAGVAIELIHCASLVHDDLPSMDDDVLRRGRPTAHVKFGEAMAILVGDALLIRAFGVLSGCQRRLCAALSAELATASGAAGMTGGQVADMSLCRVPAGAKGLRYIQMLKTAAMIRGAVRLGAVCGGASGKTIDAIGGYGEALGLAFQVYDDLLDATASAASLGKTPGKDAAADKRTWVSQIGLDATRSLGERLTEQAAQCLAPLGPRGARLARLAKALSQRTR
jgi:farnesyl diphosphate synthase